MSRSQSPKRFIDNANSNNVSAGNSNIHHSPENRKSCPIRISVPKLGLVVGTPTPRNDNVASVIIASANVIVAITNTGLKILGEYDAP